jgi:hypothetical protein
MFRSKNYFRFTLVLSVLVGVIIPFCHEWFDPSEVDGELPENWKRISIQEKLNNVDGLFSKKATFLPLSKIKRLTIRKQFKKMIVDKEDELLRDGFKYSFSFYFYVGWEELGLLGLVGFASVWMMYAVGRGATLWIPSESITHFPSPSLRGRVESLHIPIGREPVSLDNIRITLFGFLALEERPQRPKKPGAVWID